MEISQKNIGDKVYVLLGSDRILSLEEWQEILNSDEWEPCDVAFELVVTRKV
jgi:hypothetical protein